MSASGLKLKVLAGAALAAALAGCPDGANPIDNVQTAVESKPIAQGIVDASEAKRAVQAYQAQKGENPPSIEALEAVTGKLKTPPRGKKYSYDPETANIDLVDE
ncbi:MAG TPA: hypothetical protein VHF22_14465 [Planctomycetota bacterium]|nr:hypothetical protein [Planctomycetota bacterium]